MTEAKPTMREALLRCPFCGSDKLTLTVNVLGWKIVECDKCGTLGPSLDLEGDEYIDRWNTRAALSSPALPDREAVAAILMRRVNAPEGAIYQAADAILSLLKGER